MSSSPERGLKIGPFLLALTIVWPLLLVGADMWTDGKVVTKMWQYTVLGKTYTVWARNLTIAYRTVNDTGFDLLVNDTGVANSTASEQEDQSELMEGVVLNFVFMFSITILIFSTTKLLLSNPLVTLVRDARTKVMMNSRELERKDVPVPLGNS